MCRFVTYEKLTAQVQDRRDEEFIARQPWDKFPGEGQAVYGGGDASSKVASFQTPGLSRNCHTPTSDLWLNPMWS